MPGGFRGLLDLVGPSLSSAVPGAAAAGVVSSPKPAIKGRVPSTAVDPGGAAALTQSLGDSNLKLGGITFGKVQHGERAGKTDARYATIKTKAGQSEYEVPHTLGHAAGFCMLVGSENRQSPASKYIATNLRRDLWTATTCRVDVALQGAGSMDGGELTFLVGGER
jgi:hypothetical protein